MWWITTWSSYRISHKSCASNDYRKRKYEQKYNKQIDKMNGQADIKWEVVLKVHKHPKQS